MYINNNIKNIIRNYLTISKEQVKRNQKLVVYHIKHGDKFDVQLCNYCITCKEPQLWYKFYTYHLETQYLNCGINMKVIIRDSFFCENCYMTAYNKLYTTMEIKSKLKYI